MSPLRTATRSTGRWSSRLALALIVVGLIVRLVYVPMHLVQEDHLPGGHHGHVHACDEDSASVAFHEEEHTPHPAIDHECDLAFERLTNTTPKLIWAVTVAEPQLRAVCLEALGTWEETPHGPPRSTVPRARLGRAPPASV